MEKIYQNLFECDYPPRDPNPEIKRHPVYPLEVDSNGGIKPLNEDWWNYNSRLNLKPEVIIYEAWFGVVVKKFSYIDHINNNPWDVRPDNLQFISGNLEIIAKRKRFKDATIKKMHEISESLPKSIEAEDYFNLLLEDKSLIEDWKNSKPPRKTKIK